MKKGKNKPKVQVSGVIISGNSEKVIGGCLKSMKFCDEVILVDTGITDNSVSIALKNGAKVVRSDTGSYDAWRNSGMENSQYEWILYVDTDERVTEKLQEEIRKTVNLPDLGVNAYAIPRHNYILGKKFTHSGQYPDYQKRLFRRITLHRWIGEVHEEPEFDGELGHLAHPLVHLKHNSFHDMIDKTNKWSEIEAKLLYDSHHPQMAPWRMLRIFTTEFVRIFIKQKGFLDGAEGIMYGFYQLWSKSLTYAKLWELQAK